MNMQQYIDAVEKAFAYGSPRLSDWRLANVLGHDTPDAATVLLTTKSSRGLYTLRLCGIAEVRHNGDLLSSRNCGLPPHVLDLLDQGHEAVEVLNNPWFEWISEDGSHFTEAFDSICRDKTDEVLALEAFFGTDAYGGVDCVRGKPRQL